MAIKSEWWAVAIDETRFWDIPERFKGKLLRIGTEYFYDRNLHTRICSFQQHYFLHPLDYHIELSDEMWEEENEELRSEIMDWVMDGWNASDVGGDYHRIQDIDSIPDENQEAYGEVRLDEDEIEEDIVREQWSANCPNVRFPKSTRRNK